MKKSKTAVEWLTDQLPVRIYNAYQQEIRKALQMEKQQIIDSHLTGLIHPLEIEATKQAEQYYVETYETANN
jgi:hypothetical protein